MSERMTGYSLLGFGILVMLFALIQVFLVFTNRIKPISIFNLSSTTTNNSINMENILKQLQKGNSGGQSPSFSLPTPNLFPPELLNQTLNLTTNFFLMSFLMGFGFKLASLGVMLVRPIKVKLKSSLAG